MMKQDKIKDEKIIPSDISIIKNLKSELEALKRVIQT